MGIEDLKPGDIMFGPIGGLIGLGVGIGQMMVGDAFRVGSFSARHVGIVVRARTEHTPALLAQAMPSGAEIIPLTASHWTERHAYVRLPEDVMGQAVIAASMARLMVSKGVGYSFASYGALALWSRGVRTPRLERWIDRRRPANLANRSSTVDIPVEAICSVLVDQAWSLAGKRVMEGVPRQCVTPGALAGQLMHRGGATWTLPRGDGAAAWTV